MSQYEESSVGRSSHQTPLPTRPPDYGYAGGTTAPPYPVEEAPETWGEGPRIPSPGRTEHPGKWSPPRSTHEPLGEDDRRSQYRQPTRGLTNLSIPDSRSRPRSLPPVSPVESRRPRELRDVPRERRHSRSRRHHHPNHRDSEGSDEEEDLARSPLDKARHFMNDNFSQTSAGLGVGVLGALVGGLAAKEATEATMNRNHHSGHHKRDSEDDADYKRNQIISTVVGAAVGALGANVFEKKLEDRERVRHDRWERKWKPDARATTQLERREVVVARPRSGGGGGGGDGEPRSPGRWRRSWDPLDERVGSPRGSGGGGGRALQREVDPDARSWRDVQDWVYDDRKSGGGGHYRF